MPLRGQIRGAVSSRLERLAITSIRRPANNEALPTAPALSTLDSNVIEEARRRLNVIAPLLENGRCTKAQIDSARAELGVGKTTLYRWMNRYANDGRLTALCPVKRPGGRGKSRLQPEVEQIVQAVLEEYYKKPIQPTAQSTVREVNRRCRNADIDPPHPNTIRARINAIPEKTSLKTRGHKKAAHDRFTPRPGHFDQASHPLSLVQIDHTPLDLVLVDEQYRLPLHRPYLTLVFDVYSRMVLSFYISFEKPNALATGLAISRAIIPKSKWLQIEGIDELWPCWGFPATIHVDNAKEFRGEMLRLACEQYRIEIDFRPVAEPSMGGHIERVLGTIMRQQVHDIAGAARKPTVRGDYDSEDNSMMSLSEFEIRLAKYLTGIYHQQYHSGLQMAPIKKWTDAILGDGSRAGIGQFALPEDEERLKIDFMPVEKRGVHKEGVRIDNIWYYSELLRHYVNNSNKKGKVHIFHRDPRDISVIYFWEPVLNQYVSIPYRDSTHPPISAWELNEVRRHLESQGRAAVNERLIFSTYEWLRQHEERSKQQTRIARRKAERRAEFERTRQPAMKNVTPRPSVPTSIPVSESAAPVTKPKRFDLIVPLELDEDA